MRWDAAPQPARRVYTVAELNQRIQAALREAFPETVWVRGEVQRLPPDAARRKHVYFELHGAGPGVGAAQYQIPVALLEWDRQRFDLGRYLDGRDPDLRLADRLEVCLECVVDFHPPFGKLSLRMVGVDKEFTLGRLEAQRRALLERLRREGLLERNRRLELVALPLRVGLVTAAGSAAERDFLTGLADSGYGFRVWRADCRMQGESTEAQVAAAVRGLAGLPLDVIVIARGGGSRADLSWFDLPEIAVAIATCPLPVVTAIGHEIDTAIADLVAHTRCKTPTAAAQLLVDRVDAARRRLDAAAARLAALAAARAAAARRRLRDVARGLERQVGRRVRGAAAALAGQRLRLIAAATGRLARARAGTDEAGRRLPRAARAVLGGGRARLEAPAGRLRPEALLAAWPRRRRDLDREEARVARLARAALGRAAARLDALAGQARLLDPQRLLGRGYTLTLDAGGRPLKSVAGLALGDRITTRFHDGEAASVVASLAPRPRGREEEG